MSTTFPVRYNKMSIVKDVCIYSAIVMTGIAMIYGSMVAAEYMGLPAWSGLCVPCIGGAYVSLSHRKKIPAKMLIGYSIELGIMAFIYYAPFGLAISAAVATLHVASVVILEITKNIQNNSWRYLDFGLTR